MQVGAMVEQQAHELNARFGILDRVHERRIAVVIIRVDVDLRRNSLACSSSSR
jgi:hypothetical protein